MHRGIPLKHQLSKRPTHPPTHPKKLTPPRRGVPALFLNRGKTRKPAPPILRPPHRYSINRPLSNPLSVPP